MPEPLVSIIIPTYNGKQYLTQTIQSAFSQDYDNKEVIVVDDGSTENIKTLLTPYLHKITYIYQENKGPGAARNRGVLESSGEFIAFLDHDDIWARQKTSRQVNLLKKHPNCGLVYCYPTLIDQHGDEILTEKPSFFPERDVFEAFLKRNRIVSFSSVIIRRSVFDSVGGIDESPELATCDDYDLWLRISASYDVLFSPGELLYYRLHQNNFAKEYELNMNAHIAVIEKCRQSVFFVHNPNKIEYFNGIADENLFNAYRKFAFIFYYQKDRKSDLKARELFKKILKRNPFNLKHLFYYWMTFEFFVLLRGVVRKLRYYNFGKYKFK